MKKNILILTLLFFSFIVFGQNNRKVLILDLTAINNETNQSRIRSVQYIMENIKVPYDVSTSFSQLNAYPVVIASARITEGALSSTQKVQLADYVNNGGVLITSSMREPDLFPVFGITQSVSSNTLFEVSFDTSKDPLIFDYIDDDLEKTISIGKASSGNSYYTRQYVIDNAEVLGTYENNFAAFITNSFGQGVSYAFGPDFRDLVFRNLIGLDLSANRTYSNGFEPSTDVIFLIMRNIIRKHIPFSVYPHYVPSNAKSVVLITHDIDSKTAYDTMSIFAEYEYYKGFKAQYNATTKYFESTWPYYYPSVYNSTQYLLSKNQSISSHSVGHFPDFADFDLGSIGNTTANYYPVNTNGVTSGGTVLGELEVSRDLLLFNSTINIRTFRAGHLAFPDSLILGLEMTGYEFNSTHSSNDILTNYPYLQTKVKKFSGELSTILEIPMTISDVFKTTPINSSNYEQKVNIWLDATQKYANNNAPVTLLIHPNRTYKLEALRKYINSLPNEIGEYNFEDYGDFWKARGDLDFTTVYANNELKVYIASSNVHSDLSFLVDVDANTPVSFYDVNNQEIIMMRKDWRPGQALFHQTAIIGLEELDQDVNDSEIEVYPNPAQQLVTITNPGDNIQNMEVFTISGQRIVEVNNVNVSQTTLNCSNWKKGVYVLKIQTTSGMVKTQKIVVN